MRRLVVASAILATLLAVPLGSAAANPTLSSSPTDSERATAALEYLLAAQRIDGSIDKSIGETADFVIGAAAAGFDPATLHGCSGGTGALAYLATASDGAAGDAAQTGKAILAVVAAGGDPSSFAGRNLLARLAALYHSDTGAYGDGSTFSQAFAILAVVAAGGTVTTEATAHLKALKDPDSSWSYGSAPVAAGAGDTNSTAIALIALDSAGDHSLDAAALAYLRTQQLLDGGFLYASMYGPPADPDSDAIVLEALVAADRDPEGSDWLQGANSVLTHLRSTQGADGGFAYPGSGETALTTSQVPAALVRVPYAGAVHPTTGRSVPMTGCPASSPSPSASGSASSSHSASSTPTVKPTPTPTARPTVRPTAPPTSRPTASPTDPTPTDPTASASPAESTQTAPGEPNPTATDMRTPVVRVAGVTSAQGASPGPADSSPALLYVAAALLALFVVLGGGWVLTAKSGRR
jgi:hypothetical protein